MYVPFLSKRAPKGGGGGGRGGGGKGSSSKGSSSPPKSSSPQSQPSTSLYGKGGGQPFIIPSGAPFAGRTYGGGARNDVWGNRHYGSGYPGSSTYGVKQRNFPFGFWPLVFFSALSVPVYYQSYAVVTEYGLPGNTSRPGGPLVLTAFASQTSPGLKYHFLADNTTVNTLSSEVNKRCQDFVVPVNLDQAPTPFTGGNPSQPLPEQAIQYYRSSSAVLFLDGYNNTATFSSDDDIPDTPLPDNHDVKLLDCLNNTIGSAIPISDGSRSAWTMSWHTSVLPFFLIVYLIYSA